MYLFYFGLILFSLAGIVYVLASKIFEMKTGKPGLFTRMSASADPHILRTIETATLFTSRVNLRNVQRVLTFASGHLFHAFGTAGLFVAKHYGNFTSRVRGKKFLKSGGVVSFFLKDVAESKEENKNI